MRWSLAALVLATSCATPTFSRVKLADLPRASPAVVYALPKGIVRLRGALTKKDVTEPRCSDGLLAISLGLEREKPSSGWSVSDLELETYPVADFDQLYAIEDGSSAFVTHKLSLQFNDNLALAHARMESTNAAVEFAKGVVRIGAEVAAGAISMSPAAVPKLRGSAEDQARETLCQAAAQSLIQIRTARLDVYKAGEADRDALAAADEKLAAVERSIAQTFTGVARVTRLPFECRVDPGELTSAPGKPLDLVLVSVDLKAGKLVAAGRECLATAEAWSAEGASSTTPVTLQIAPNFVSTPAQRVASKVGGLAYRLPANAELSVSVGGEARVRTSRPLPQLGIVLTLPPSSLSGSMEVDLDPSTGALRKVDATRVAPVTDVPAIASAASDAATVVRKAQAGAGQAEVDAIDLELERLKKTKALREERAKAAEEVRE